MPAALQISNLSGCSVYSKPIFNSVNYNPYFPTLFGPAAAGPRQLRGWAVGEAGAQAVPAAVTGPGAGGAGTRSLRAAPPAGAATAVPCGAAAGSAQP